MGICEFSMIDKESIDWFDRNIKFDDEDWQIPICSRCQEPAPIVAEAFGYGSLHHICEDCIKEIKK